MCLHAFAHFRWIAFILKKKEVKEEREREREDGGASEGEKQQTQCGQD